MLGDGLLTIVELAVAVILFEGALNLDLGRLRRSSASIQRLLTWGALITVCGATLAAELCLGWGWPLSFVFGSLVMVTGPTVIRPLLAELRLRPQLATVLEAEGVLIDPIGALVAAVALAVATSADERMGPVALGLLGALGSGIGMGVLGGLALAAAMRPRRLVPEGLPNVLILASVLLLYETSEHFAQASGLLAVTLAGVLVSNLVSRDLRELSEFKDQISILLIGLLFVLLAADVRLEELWNLGWPGLGVVASLILLVRPLAVALATHRTELRVPERALLSWIAPRGIVAAAIASVAAVELERSGAPGASEIRAMVFLTITCTVVLAGVSAGPVARILGLRLPERTGFAILGAHPFALLIGNQLRASGAPVLFLDSNPDNCRLGEEAGFPVVFGNALEERTLERARLGSVAATIGLTTNAEVNGLFVMRAHQLLRVPRGYIALSQLRRSVTPEFVQHVDADVLFEAAHDLDRWSTRVARGEVEIEHWRVGAAQDKRPQLSEVDHGERFVLFALQRGGKLIPMRVRERLRSDDIAWIAVHVPELEAARETLGRCGLERIPTPPQEPRTAAAAR
jgi:NhaP-type Na+/H+ or K+/H+ antiporter